MKIYKNKVIDGRNNLPVLLDYGYQETGKKKPVIIFAHGFKGFKDWGHFNKVMEYFIEEGFVYVKFNFSHNGGTVEQPIDFPDLEAFGNNNYSKELDDLKTVMDWIEQTDLIPSTEIDKNEIYLIGHSRGGGISIIATNEDNRIKKLATWAAVADLVNRFPKDVIKQWEKDGVMYIENGRTKQQMPLYYQFAEDTVKNIDRFNVQTAASNICVPHLIVHGTEDVPVPIADAYSISKWNANAELKIIEGANHVFGAMHPFKLDEFPPHVKEVLQTTLDFLKK